MKITIDELINMNKNEMPKRIKIENDIFIYDNEENDYIYEDGNISLFNDYIPDIYHLEDLKEAINQKVEIIEEEKKIPEKLEIEQDTPNSNYYIRNEYGTKCYLTKHSKIIADKVNQVIDYLNSKGE